MLWSSSTGLAITDRGLQFGDGVFETLLAVGSPNAQHPAQAWLLDEHLDRLRQGCDRLGILYPDALIRRQTATALGRVNQGFAVLKLVVTAQSPTKGPMRGYARDKLAEANLHCSLHPARATPLDQEEPVRLRVVQTSLATQPALAGIKHLNRLEQILARRELAEGDFEGLMLNPDQGVVECTSSNLLAVIDGQLCTPPLDNCGVAGVLRNHLLASMPGRVSVQTIDLELLRRAEEVVVCNSVYGVRSVGELVAPSWKANYVQGPTFEQLQQQLSAELKQLVTTATGAPDVA